MTSSFNSLNATALQNPGERDSHPEATVTKTKRLRTHRGPEPTLVQTARVAREDLQAKVTANGKVQAQRKVDISATIAGQVTHLAVKEGDRVRKGQFLLQIDAANPRAAARSSEASMQALLPDLDSARASLEQARLDYRRAQENHKANIIANADLDRAATGLATAQAAVQGAERRVDQARATLEGMKDTLSKTTVTAPIDGIVTAKRVEEGEVAVIGVLNQPGTVLVTASVDEVRAVMRALRHTSFKAPDPFGIVTAESLQALWRQISAAAFILSLLIASVSLGVSGIVIMNIMLVAVVERAREIGVRMALGARKRDIRRQFLLEAAFLSVAGGLVGVVLGALAAFGMRGLLNFPASVTPPIVLAGIALSAGVGLLAGYWPARSASNLPVVDALRTE
jgi:multidrug efflux pump subunit AcrA (membrane-fusion protein)